MGSEARTLWDGSTAQVGQVGRDTRARTAAESWLGLFEKLHRRKLRVLHIGNIANNGYLVAKFLRRAGVDTDVLSYDYYHVMGTPEWEEVLVRHDYGDDNRPQFSNRDVGDYERPRWFVAGPLFLCIGYLLAFRGGDRRRCKEFWRQLQRAQRGQTTRNVNIDAILVRKHPATFSEWLSRFLRRAAGLVIMMPYLIARSIGRTIHRALNWLGFGAAADRFVEWARRDAVVRGVVSGLIAAKVKVAAPCSDLVRFDDLTEEFGTLFPDRSDQLSLSDLAPYTNIVAPLKALFENYDIIQAYATDPILPLICGNKPFVAFEHGTLRTFIRENNPLHRLTALAYRKANHVFVTNGDCIEHARWLGCENATAMLHPIDVEQHRRRDEAGIKALRNQHDADVLLFCPVRHDWSVKGTDIHIRALPRIRERVAGKVVLLLAPWGLQIQESRQLIQSLGCESSVAWLVRPLSRVELILHMQAADVVLDQMILPHFGATAPQALAAGSPVVMSYKPASTAWIVDEPAPILPAFSPEEVADAVVTALDSAWRAEFKDRARLWVDLHHHQERLVQDHLTVYRRILEEADVRG